MNTNLIFINEFYKIDIKLKLFVNVVFLNRIKPIFSLKPGTKPFIHKKNCWSE